MEEKNNIFKLFLVTVIVAFLIGFSAGKTQRKLEDFKKIDSLEQMINRLKQDKLPLIKPCAGC